MLYAGYAAVLGAAAGFLIGVVVGSVLGVIVTVSPHRIRRSIMTGAIPLVAVAVSAAPIVIVGRGRAVVFLVAIDMVLTVAGAAWLLVQYDALEARYGARRVH